MPGGALHWAVQNARAFALPLLGVLVIAAWFLFRPAVQDTAPAAAPAPGASTSPPSREGPSAAESRAPAGAPPAAAPAGTPPATTVRDTARSDAMRRALRERWRDEGGGSNTSKRRTSAPEGGSEAAAGKLDEAYIRSRIEDDLIPIANECYEAALEDDPKLAGKLVMSFGIAGDEEVGGVVDEAAIDPTSTMHHPELGECMRESTMSLSFPPPEGGGRTDVTYSFEFSPDAPATK